MGGPFLGLPATVSPADSLRAMALGPELLTAGTGVSAGIATYMDMIPAKSIKNELMDQRLVINELVGTLIRDTATVRLYKHNEPSFSTYQRFDKMGWLLRNMIGTPVTTRYGTASTSNKQTFTFGSAGTWANGDTFSIGIGGYQTSTITFSSTDATLLGNITTAVSALPSVKSCATTGTANMVVTLTGTAPATAFVMTAGKNLAGVNIPLMLGTVISNAAGNSLTVANTTPGVGAFRHTFTAGAAGKLPLTFGEYDGVSFKLCQSGAIDTADLTLAMNDAPLWAIKMISQAEVDYAFITTASNAFPNYFFSPYIGPSDPSMCTIVLNSGSGSSTAARIIGGAKLSGKNNRDALSEMGSGSTDMSRATEGIVSWSGAMTLRYLAYTGSEYYNFINNYTPAGSVNTPGAITMQWADTNTSIGTLSGGTAIRPTVSYVIPNPKYGKGSRNPEPAEPQQVIEFTALLDPSTQTSLSAVLINEVPSYTTLAA